MKPLVTVCLAVVWLLLVDCHVDEKYRSWESEKHPECLAERVERRPFCGVCVPALEHDLVAGEERRGEERRGVEEEVT